MLASMLPIVLTVFNIIQSHVTEKSLKPEVREKICLIFFSIFFFLILVVLNQCGRIIPCYMQHRQSLLLRPLKIGRNFESKFAVVFSFSVFHAKSGTINHYRNESSDISYIIIAPPSRKNRFYIFEFKSNFEQVKQASRLMIDR